MAVVGDKSVPMKRLTEKEIARMMKDPLDALPKDKGWAWMSLLGKETLCTDLGKCRMI